MAKPLALVTGGGNGVTLPLLPQASRRGGSGGGVKALAASARA